jgi:LysR family transcriptional regulator, glycine cleavage system transcriptional activator
MLKLPPLAAVRAFEAAARHQSFTRAAAELGMTQAAVSYQIKLLEDRLGQALFARQARQVRLTAAGQRLAPAVTEAFGGLRAAFVGFAQESETVLAITALHTLAANWLVPRLGAFQLTHPDLAVRLDTSDEMLDLARDGFDVGIRAGLGLWPGHEAHLLMPMDLTAVCSPAFRERMGLERPEDLLRAPLIGPTDVWWTMWFAAAGIEDADLSRHADIRLGHQQFEGNAAIAGLGAAVVLPQFFQAELEAGRLVRPFDVTVRYDRGYWLVYPEARGRSPKIRAFRDWILTEAERDRGDCKETS